MSLKKLEVQFKLRWMRSNKFDLQLVSLPFVANSKLQLLTCSPLPSPTEIFSDWRPSGTVATGVAGQLYNGKWLINHWPQFYFFRFLHLCWRHYCPVHLLKWMNWNKNFYLILLFNIFLFFSILLKNNFLKINICRMFPC